MRKLPKNSGQALLVTLLIMAVALTIGLAVTSRTVTDIEISEQTEEAARAFSAAEAGIEEALVTAIGEKDPEGSFDEGEVTYKTKRDFLGAGNKYIFPDPSSADDVRTLWLAEHETLDEQFDRGLLRILWGTPGASPAPALEISVYYESGGEYRVIRFPLDSQSGRSQGFCESDGTNCEGVYCGAKGFCTGGASLDGVNFQYDARIRFDILGIQGTSDKLLFARFRFLYSDEIHPLGVAAGGVGSGEFPSQGIRIESVGTAGEATRKVEVVRLHPAPPGIFDFLLYSETDLNK